MKFKKLFVCAVSLVFLFGFLALSACSDGMYQVSVAYHSEVVTLRAQPEEEFTLDDIQEAKPEWFDLDTGFVKVLYTDEACTQEFDGTVQDGMKLYLRDAYPAHMMRVFTVHLTEAGAIKDTRTIELTPANTLSVQTLMKKIPEWFENSAVSMGIFTDEACTQEFTGSEEYEMTVYLKITSLT